LDVVWCLRTLALNLVAQKRLPEAEELYRRQLPIWAKIRGADSDGYAETVRALADLLKSENKPANVDVLYREVLAAQRAALGHNSSAVAETLSGLSDSLQSQGKQSEAEKASRDALDITLKLIGQDSVKLPSLLRQETQNLAALGKAPDGEKLYTDAIRAARQNKGSKPFLADLLHDFAQFLDYQENKPSAGVDQYLQELFIRRAYTNDDLHYALRGLGDALLAAGNPKEAEPYLREALAVYRKLHQQDEFYATVWTVENLGDALYQQHRLPEAEQAYREALATCEKLGTAR